MEVAATPLEQRLARLVVKNEVGLGGLASADQALAFALVWRVLPAGTTHSEPGINAQLKAALSGAAAWLDVDHVELRRWLVDSGWLWRDGWGREYRRVEPEGLTAEQGELAAALQALDAEAWVAGQRRRHQAAREQRRRLHAHGGQAA
ncbi:Exonuclease SbcC [Rubrivivax sp. A210]|uniref:DUF2087 domain-containing protein n=1 Tax=Rubrivivax sp. A210 TaxID=2772301 RepID=UPI00191B37A3|nr:DUF2087 domain-containing protein [Rubrivivax sp. A210]CAD5365858.1 Exonuclease SbcC [Rubrivivax sp. A210]